MLPSFWLDDSCFLTGVRLIWLGSKKIKNICLTVVFVFQESSCSWSSSISQVFIRPVNNMFSGRHFYSLWPLLEHTSQPTRNFLDTSVLHFKFWGFHWMDVNVISGEDCLVLLCSLVQAPVYFYLIFRQSRVNPWGGPQWCRYFLCNPWRAPPQNRHPCCSQWRAMLEQLDIPWRSCSPQREPTVQQETSVRKIEWQKGTKHFYRLSTNWHSLSPCMSQDKDGGVGEIELETKKWIWACRKGRCWGEGILFLSSHHLSKLIVNK